MRLGLLYVQIDFLHLFTNLPHTTMKTSIFLIALGVFFIFCCNESPNSAPEARVNDPLHPTAAHAVFDIPTPELSGSVSGSTASLSWTNGNTTGSESSGGEFWGSTQNSIVAGSGHTDIFQNDVKIGESTDGTYDVTGLTDGVYNFTVQEKSLEGSVPNQNTHHSLVSNTVTLTIGECLFYVQRTGGNGTWNNLASTMTFNKMAATWAMDFQLYDCDGIVSDGTSVSATFNSTTYNASYDATTNTYHINLTNPTHKSAGTWSLQFIVDGNPDGTWSVSGN